MARKTAPLLPPTQELLRDLGERLRLARLRRRLTAKQVAERAGMAPMTLRSLERGLSGVTVGACLAVMQVLGIEKEIDQLAQADRMGRDLQDSRLPARRTRGAHDPASAVKSPPRRSRHSPQASKAMTDEQQRTATEDARKWVQRSGFASAKKLADLIEPELPPPNRRWG